MSQNTRRRRTIARHGQLRTPGPISQLLKFLAIGLSVVVISGIAVASYIAYDFASTVSANAVDLEGQKPVPPDISALKGGFNIVLAGLDTCEDAYKQYFGERCSGADAEGHLNDVNLLLHVSDSPRRVTVVSIPRDLMTTIPQCVDEDGKTHAEISKEQINQAYSDAGLSCVAKTISEVTGQEIQFAASVTFGGVIEITNAIGGVDVCLATPIKDKYTSLDLSAGEHTLKGIEALQFLRTRHGVGDGSDLGRIGNQQQYMSNLAKKLISADTLGNVPVMLKLATTAVDNLETSTSLDASKIVQIALAVKSVPFEDIVFLQYPTLEDPDNSAKVIADKTSAKSMWDAINANAQLQVTYTNTANDGVIVTDPGPTASATAVDPSATPNPSPSSGDVVALPDTVKGTSAAQTTCSNGNVR